MRRASFLHVFHFLAQYKSLVCKRLINWETYNIRQPKASIVRRNSLLWRRWHREVPKVGQKKKFIKVCLSGVMKEKECVGDAVKSLKGKNKSGVWIFFLKKLWYLSYSWKERRCNDNDKIQTLNVYAFHRTPLFQEIRW